MGYLENALPKWFARLGVETHVVTADRSPYSRVPQFREAVADFGEELEPGTVENLDGYTLHVLGAAKVAGYVRLKGLRNKLASIRPDIVQTMVPVGWIPLDAAMFKLFLGYKLFTGAHMSASSVPQTWKAVSRWGSQDLRRHVTRTLPGRLTSFVSEKCYAVTEDCCEVAVRYSGVQSHKVELMYLGVDTECFFPVASDAARFERLRLRTELGFAEDDIVCIYTGKFTEEKNVLILAQAIDELRSKGRPFRGLFIGGGPRRQDLEKYSACKVLDFMPFRNLARYYCAGEIGVWTGNESISMLDAAACGIPIVISDLVAYRAPVEGNGRVFRLNDVPDLVRVLIELQEPETRARLGSIGAARMAKEFSWESVARRRLKDYVAALGNGAKDNAFSATVLKR